MADSVFLGSAYAEIDIKTGKLTKGLSSIQTQMKGLESISNSSLKSVTNGLDNLADKTVKAGLVIGTALAASGVALATFATKTTGDYEMNRVAFETMLGSAEVAGKTLKKLSDFAAKTPFELPQVVTASKQLLAYGFTADELIPTMRKLGDVSAALNVPIGDMAYLFGTLKVQGRAYTRDILQFTQRGIDVVGALATQLGKTKSEINEMVTAGEIGFEEVNKAFTTMTSEGGKYFNMMDKQSQTLPGILSNIKDNVTRVILAFMGMDVEGNIEEGSAYAKMKKTAQALLDYLDTNRVQIAEAMQEVATKIIEAIEKIAKKFIELYNAYNSLSPKQKEFITDLTKITGALLILNAVLSKLKIYALLSALPMIFNTLGAVIAAFKVGGMVTGFSTLASSMGLLGTAAKGLGAALMFLVTNPIGWIILGIIALATAIYFIIKHWDTIGPWLKDLWTGIATWFKDFWNGLSIWFNNLITGISDFFIGVWEGIASWFKGIGTVIGGIFNTIAGTVMGVLTTLYNWFEPFIYMFYQIFRVVFWGVLAFWKLVWIGIETIFKAVWWAIQNFLIPLLTGIFNFIVSIFTSIFNGIVWFLQLIWDGIVWYFTRVYNFWVGVFTSIWSFIVYIFSAIWNAIRGPLDWIWNKITGVFGAIWGAIRGPLENVWSGIVDIFNGIKDTIFGIIGDAYNWGKNLINNFVQGIKDLAGKVGDAAKGIADKLKGFVGFHSPTKEGPGREADEWMPNLLNMFIKQAKAGLPRLENVFSGMATAMSINPNLVGATAIGGTTANMNNTYNVSVDIGMYGGTEIEKRKIALELASALDDVRISKGNEPNLNRGGLI